MMGRLCYVEGLPGSGKSTYCREVGQRLNYRVFKEPVDKAHLTRFYSDPNRYAWNLQVHLLHRRIGIQRLAACESLYSDIYDGALIDRCLMGDASFEQMHYEDGNISDLDHETYKAALLGMKLDIFPPTTLVYIDARPETCLERIRERAKKEDRPYEDGIMLEYLQRLSGHYKQLIKTVRDGRWPWGHSIDVQHIQWDPATTTSSAWDAVASGLREDWA